jgi:predicted HicB family RNase H-like nuclease
MKRVIDGKTYNTNTASVVARYDYQDDNGYEVEARIYITKGGAFFIVHAWEVPESLNRDAFSKHYVEAISRDELDRLVVRQNLEIVDESVVQPPPEATAEVESAATIYVRVPAPLKRRVDEAAAGARLSANAWVMRCLETCLS